MVQAKAVIFDYIGTLVNAKSYSMEASTAKLYGALVAEGFKMGQEEFLDAYRKAHEKYSLVRYGELREVTNAVWISEALQSLGFEVALDDVRMVAALNVFFEDYVDSLELRSCAEKLLEKAGEFCKVGLVSNFTYAPVVHASLRRLGIDEFFDCVVVSNDCGWRKPHRKIFEEALSRLEVKPSEAVFVGDSPSEDTAGALDLGLRTVFVPSHFNSLDALRSSGLKPDFVVGDLEELWRSFSKIVGC
jgi:FMN phosphatase YigB (HAD superfamily)